MTQTYPIVYRLCFLWFEPLLGFAGALRAAIDPRSLLAGSFSSVRYHDDMWPVMVVLMGAWLVIVYQKGWTMRKNTEHRVWWELCFAHCLSDVCYLYAYAYSIGVARFFNPLLWLKGDWITNPSTTIPFLIRLAFLSGVGLSSAIGAAGATPLPIASHPGAQP